MEPVKVYSLPPCSIVASTLTVWSLAESGVNLKGTPTLVLGSMPTPLAVYFTSPSTENTTLVAVAAVVSLLKRLAVMVSSSPVTGLAVSLVTESMPSLSTSPTQTGAVTARLPSACVTRMK